MIATPCYYTVKACPATCKLTIVARGASLAGVAMSSDDDEYSSMDEEVCNAQGAVVELACRLIKYWLVHAGGSGCTGRGRSS